MKLSLVRLSTCVWVTDLQETMMAIKKAVQDGPAGAQAMQVLLSDDSGEENSPLNLLMVSLLLPHEVVSVTITVLLALSFSGKFAETFVR